MTKPVLTNFATIISFAENTVNATPQLLDASITFTDPDNNFSGGSLSLTGLLAEDRVSVRDQGIGAGKIGLSGANVTFGGVAIGTVSGGAGAALTITFNAAATSASIDALIQNLTYANTSDTPTANRNLLLNITDAAGADLGQMPGQPSFAALTGAANPFNGIDFGDAIQPNFVDLDADGDLDMVLGEVNGSFLAFENTAGMFTQLLGTSNPFNGLSIGTIYSKSSFGDLDNDGDLDMISGSFDGTLHSFRNDGGVYSELTGPANPFDFVRVAPEDWPLGMQTYPAFVDLDGDGDLDVVLGERYGSLRAFRNDAGVFAELTGGDNPFNGVDVGMGAAPSFVDLDGDGDLDAVIGTYHGLLLSFRNNAGEFSELTGAANPFDGVAISPSNGINPAFFDVNGDGDLDLVLGNYDGTLLTFENTTTHGLGFAIMVTPQTDVINGTAGNDSLIDTLGPDRISGLAGDDTLQGSVGNDTMFGGTGLDSVLGGVGRDLLFGGNDSDILSGGADNDRIDGGAGNDSLVGGTGNDYLIGGGGNDTYVVDATGDRVFETTTTASILDAGGIDTVRSSVTFSLDASAGVRFVERLTLTGTAAINGTGNALANTLTGNTGNNALNGGLGNDWLNGGLGNDRLIGGGGNDTYVVDATGDRVFETTTTASILDAGGIDTVRSSVTFSLDASAGVRFVERLTLTGTAAINGTGNALANTLTGNTGNNALNGGLGMDTMQGGAGNDTFAFNTALGAGNIDRITDFNVVDDTIRLDDAIFVGLATGSLAASAFAANLTGQAATGSDRIIYETDTGRLFFDGDGVGGVARVQFATLSTGIALTNLELFVF